MTALGFTFLGFTAGIGALACSTVGDASDEDPFRGSAAGADGGGGAGDGSAAAGGDEPGLVGGGSNAGGSTGGASTACDAAIAIEDIDPFYAAAAMGLCQRYDGSADGWGLVSATYMMPNGDAGMNPISHGILSNFGVVEPLEGDRFAVLSSGTARPPGHPQWIDAQPNANSSGDMKTYSDPPQGFPVPFTRCGGGDAAGYPLANDGAALELVIKAPENAEGIAFDFSFYTVEYPYYVCSEYNDYFVVLMDPPPATALNGNISFDNVGSPISVNNALLEVCQPGSWGGLQFSCPKNDTELGGTGYEGHAATGWLTTQVPVTPGKSFSLRFAIWDAGDHVWDSSVLIDNFRWILDGPPPHETTPVPPPM